MEQIIIVLSAVSGLHELFITTLSSKSPIRIGTLVFWDSCFWEELYPSSTKSCGWTSLHMANSGCNSNTSLKFQQYCIGFVELCDVVIYSLLRLDPAVRTYNRSVYSKYSFP